MLFIEKISEHLKKYIYDARKLFFLQEINKFWFIIIFILTNDCCHDKRKVVTDVIDI